MDAKSISLEDFDEPPEEMVRAVDEGLEAHNHGAAPLGDVRPLAAIARDGHGRVVGGAVGRTWGQCCELLQLWVSEEHRRLGLASALVARFERRAAARGCSVYYLTTLSYQAPEFYRTLGYSSIAQISGYPNGIVKHLMSKVVRQGADDA
ncbi:MAG: GNAT family N-acetyltransferase [Phycisphaerales bacterium]|nr:GNAT family N-acetyltransferase [Phycisphaerales bacterium]